MESAEIRFVGDGQLPAGSFVVPVDSVTDHFEELVGLSGLSFYVMGKRLSGTLLELLQELKLGNETCLEVEVLQKAHPPQFSEERLLGDWVSRVRIRDSHVVVADYAGNVHVAGRKINVFQDPVKDFDFAGDKLLVISKLGGLKILGEDLESEQTLLSHLEKVAVNSTSRISCLGGVAGQIYLGTLGHELFTENMKKRKLEGECVKLVEFPHSHSDCVSGLEWYSLDSVISTSMDRSVYHLDLERMLILSSLLTRRVTLT